MNRRGNAHLVLANVLALVCLVTLLPGCFGGGGKTVTTGGTTAPSIPVTAGFTGTRSLAVTAGTTSTLVSFPVSGMTPNSLVSLYGSQGGTPIATAMADSFGNVVFASISVRNGSRFTIQDGDSSHNSDVTVQFETTGGTPNVAPVVTAIVSQNVLVNALVTFVAQATDENGDTLTYAWTQTSGPTATISGATTSTMSFTPATAGTYVFTVVVDDGHNGHTSTTATVTVTAPHSAPVVAAVASGAPVVTVGTVPSVPVQTAVSLRATVGQLFDNATVASYLWEQTAPTSPVLTITGASTASASVTPASAGSYTFRVTVTDSQGGVGTASVTLTVTPANAKPIANAGAAQYGVGYDAVVTLNGAGSSDPDGTSFTYKWTQAATDKKKVTLQSATAANPTFTTTDIPGIFSAAGYLLPATEYGVLALPGNAMGTYNFTLTVQDPAGLTATNTVEVVSAWRNNGTTNGEVGAHVYFVAPAGAASYNWSIVSAPTGSTAQLSGATSRFARLSPDKAGIYTVKEGTRASLKYNASKFAGIESCAGCHGPDGSQPDKVTSFNTTSHANTLQRYLNRAGATTLSSLRSRTVGFNPTVTAVSGWDDDYATAQSTGFSFPVSRPLNYYDTTFPAELKVLANQQCETCHGPGANHLGNKQKIGKTYSVAVCGQCHSTQPAEWAKAKHSEIVASPASRAGCTACHNGPAYVAVTGSFPTTGTIKAWSSTTDWMSTAAANLTTTGFGASAHTCAVCHDPHAAPTGDTFTDFQLRVFDRDITLKTGLVVKNTGTAATCITCHHGRTAASTIPTAPVTSVTGTTTKTYGSRLGMHYSPQADVLFGTNGAELPGEQYSNSEHKNVVHELCVSCHMAPVPRGTTADAGGHTWRMKKSDGSNNAAVACATCHTGLTTYDRPARDDYDGDGTVEGIQTEVHGLLTKLDEAMEAATVKVDINGVQKSAWAHYKLTEYAYKLTPDQMKAAWNWRLVEEDRSFGVHNAAYTVQLLQKSYKLVTGQDIAGATLRPARKN